MKGRKRVVKKTISLPQHLLDAGIDRARRDSRSFSGYVQRLIQKDSDGDLKVNGKAVAA